MSKRIRYQLWIAAAAGVIFFTNLGATGLWDMDEALYASCAREMYQRGDWVTPRFNGRMFPEKPPLMFWTMIAGFKLFGVNELGARFFSAVMGLGTAMIAFHLGRLLLSARVGLWTGLITASTIIFTVSARAATVDSALTFVTAAAMLMFVLGRRSGIGGQGSEGLGPAALADSIGNPKPTSPFPVSRPLHWPYAVLMYAFIGLAVLAKGPVGMVLPLAVVGLYVLIEGGWRRIFRSVWELRPLTAIVVIAAVAAPWYIMVGLRTDGQWLRGFFLEFNLRPFRQPILGHGEAGSLQHVWAVAVSILYYFYHVPAILFGFFPWSVFIGPTLIYTVQRLRKKKGSELFLDGKIKGSELFFDGKKKGSELFFDGDLPGNSLTPEKIVPTPFLIACCWFGVWFAFWSICKTKLPHYLLPAYPALALLTACWIDRWLVAKEGASHKGGPSPFSPRWPRYAWLSTILAGLGIVVAVPIVAAYYLPGEAIIGLVGLIPIAGGAWCWRLTAKGRKQQAMWVFAVMSVLFLTAAFGFAAQRVDRHQNAEPILEAIRGEKGVRNLLPERPFGCCVKKVPDTFFALATYRFFRESMVYYSGRTVTRCEGDRQEALGELADFIALPGRSYVIATDRCERELEEAFPERLHEIFRHPRFLAPGELIVFRCEDGVAGESGSTKPET